MGCLSNGASRNCSEGQHELDSRAAGAQKMIVRIFCTGHSRQPEMQLRLWTELGLTAFRVRTSLEASQRMDAAVLRLMM